MKKIIVVALLVIGGLSVSGQNQIKIGSRGGLGWVWSELRYKYYPSSYTDSTLIPFKLLKDTAAAIRASAGGTVSGQTNWYGIFTSATAIGKGAIQDTLSAIYLHRKNLYFNIPNNVNQIWFYAVQDETGHTTYLKGLNPYTGNGWSILHDSTTNQNRIIAYGTNSDFYFQGMRNVTFSNTGTTTMVTSLVVAGVSSSALITASLSGGNGMKVISTAANSYAGQEWVNQGGENMELRVTGSTYGSYPSRTAIWFASTLNGQTTFLYGASALNKLYIGGLNLTTDLQRTDGIGYTMYKASTYINWGTTSGTSGYGFRDNGGTMEYKNSAGAWTSFASAISLTTIGSSPNANGATLSSGVLNLEPASASFGGVMTTGTQTIAGAKTWTGNATFSGTGAAIISTSGTSGIVASGTNFGGEFSSGSSPFLASNSATTAGSVIVGYFQRSGSYTGLANDADVLSFAAKNSAGVSKVFAELHAVLTTATSTSEVGAFVFKMMEGGATAATRFTIFGTGNTLHIASAYDNYGTTSGTSGYGFRDNGGTMQWKNSGGSWQDIGTGGGGGSAYFRNGRSDYDTLLTNPATDTFVIKSLNQTFTNGLTTTKVVTDTTVSWANVLGGSLTQNTTITGGGFSFTLGDAEAPDLNGFYVYSDYSYLGGKFALQETTSSAGTLTLGDAGIYGFNGTTSTWTLPALTGNEGVVYKIKNAGSGTITLNSNAGGNDIYSTSAVNTYAITAGSAIEIWQTAGKWCIKP